MLSNEKLYPIVTELFMRDLKLNISPVFTAQSYFAVPKNIRLNSQDDFFINISNKRKLQQITFNHSSDIEFQDFLNLYKNVLQNHIFFSDWCYSNIRFFFTFQREYFRKNIITNNDN